MPFHAALKLTLASGPSLLLSLCLILLLTCPFGSALRGLTPADHKRAAEVQYMIQKQPGGKSNTAYGSPLVQTLTRNTSVNHFGSVQYTRNNTFQMRYVLFWPIDPPTSIFLFCGQEDTLENVGVGSGYYSDLANSTRALQIWPEHRYYAKSARYAPADNFAQFTIEQALVDHIELVLHVQNTLNLTRAPVIALGSSYSGQLASWLRMRYPDVIAGAISSSPTSFGCPGLGLDPSYDLYGPYQVVTRTASAAGGSATACPKNVQSFFQTIFSLGSTSSGRQQINQGMRLCGNSNVTSSSDVQDLAMYVQNQWFSAAQYNSPLPDVGQIGVPAYRVRVACDFLKSSNLSAPQLLGGMKSALSVFDATQNQCLNTSGSSSGFDKFGYQVCNQDQTPISSDGVNDMFFNNTYSLDGNDQQCVRQFGIHAQYNWAAYNFGLSTIRQSSNIFFTNGNFDPFTACGPTADISPTITTAIYEGCHACDFGDADPADPPSVTSARRQGAALIAQWISDYNSDLQEIPLSNAANLFQLAYSLGGYIQSVNDTLAGSGVMRTQAVAAGTANYSNGATVV